jgi:Yip1-like protein
MASPKDLVTVLYRPRETMRRVLDGGRDRWTVPLIVLAFICASVGDSDIPELGRVLPGLSLSATLALVALGLLLFAACWVIALYVFALLATIVGRWLEGQGEIADVRAALAWGVVPVIWTVILRIPIAVYSSRLIAQTPDKHRMLMDFILKGGCVIAALATTYQLLLFLWVMYVVSSTVGEALRFSSWKGLATIAMTVGVPVIIAVAAALAFKT